MFDFSKNTKEIILKRQLDHVTNALDKREGSIIHTALAPASWEIEGIYLDLANIQRNAFTLFAVGVYLEHKAAERGIIRKRSTPAKRLGLFDAPLSLGDRFSTIAGSNSITFFVSKDLGFDAGYYMYELTAEVAGIAGNNYNGSLLPITFIQDLSFAAMTEIILDGTDEETDDALRRRYLDSLNEQPFAGNIAAYRQILLAEDDVGAVQVYPVWQGGGTVLCSVINANYDVAAQDLIDRLQVMICPPVAPDDNPTEYGLGYAPIGAIATIMTAAEFPVDIEMSVQVVIETSIVELTQEINEAINNYFLGVRQSWGNMVVSSIVPYINYPVAVYAARIMAAVIAVPGVVNVTNLTLNGNPGDLILTETSVLQQLPIPGTVILNDI